MDEPKNETLEVLTEIRNTLNCIYACFEEQYLEIQKRKYGDKVQALEAILTDPRRKIFPLLFDERHLSQGEIAKTVGVSRQAVSQFISLLIKYEIIEQHSKVNKIIYNDKYNLIKLVQQ
jgi:DNA-directed RNA polymerase specialized sigma subunit